MLGKIIVSSYSVLLEVAIWLTLLGGFIGGWAAYGFTGAIVGLVVSFIFSIVVFGAFLTLIEIQKSVRALQEKHDAVVKSAETI